ncbi:MAG: hypothetical protein GY705_15340 [Bacteroidetes bacterium]|nr:hypothetical protein [Bacteroidota bacterium]
MFIAAVVSFLGSCTFSGRNTPEEDRLLTKVYNKSLYLSDLEGMIPENISTEDTSLIVNAYVERWIRGALLLHEAERNIPSDLNIDELVRDYRASLIRHNYEQILVEELLDSTITQERLTDFYERNKEQYQLETPIIRCYFIRIALSTPGVQDLQKWWNGNTSEDSLQLAEFCETFAEVHLLEDSIWYSVDDIATELPEGTLSPENVNSKKDFTLKDDLYQYYFKMFELKNKKEIAPLSFIEGQARKVILHKRKIKLLEEKKADMYEMELRKGNVKIYSQ